MQRAGTELALLCWTGPPEKLNHFDSPATSGAAAIGDVQRGFAEAITTIDSRFVTTKN